MSATDAPKGSSGAGLEPESEPAKQDPTLHGYPVIVDDALTLRLIASLKLSVAPVPDDFSIVLAKEHPENSLKQIAVVMNTACWQSIQTNPQKRAFHELTVRRVQNALNARNAGNN